MPPRCGRPAGKKDSPSRLSLLRHSTALVAVNGALRSSRCAALATVARKAPCRACAECGGRGASAAACHALRRPTIVGVVPCSATDTACAAQSAYPAGGEWLWEGGQAVSPTTQLHGHASLQLVRGSACVLGACCVHAARWAMGDGDGVGGWAGLLSRTSRMPPGLVCCAPLQLGCRRAKVWQGRESIREPAWYVQMVDVCPRLCVALQLVPARLCLRGMFLYEWSCLCLWCAGMPVCLYVCVGGCLFVRMFACVRCLSVSLFACCV